jgi:hypothetical protein
VRKRRGLDTPVDAFVRRVNVVGSFVRVNIVDAFVRRVNVVGSFAFRDTDLDTFGGTAACVGYAVSGGGACVVSRWLVLPAHKWREVLPTRSVLSQR